MHSDEAVSGHTGVKDLVSKGHAGDAIPGVDPVNLFVDAGHYRVRPGMHGGVTKDRRPGQGVDPHQVREDDLRGDRQGQQLQDDVVEGLGVVGHCCLDGGEQGKGEAYFLIKGKNIQDAGRHYQCVGGKHNVVRKSSSPELADGGVPDTNYL